MHVKSQFTKIAKNEQRLDFVRPLPRLPNKRLVVVLDNGSIHVSRRVRDATAKLRTQRIYLYFLPPCSLELNLIEPVVDGIRAHDLLACAYTSRETLETAITDGFTHAEQRLSARSDTQL